MRQRIAMHARPTCFESRPIYKTWAGIAARDPRKVRRFPGRMMHKVLTVECPIGGAPIATLQHSCTFIASPGRHAAKPWRAIRSEIQGVSLSRLAQKLWTAICLQRAMALGSLPVSSAQTTLSPHGDEPTCGPGVSAKHNGIATRRPKAKHTLRLLLHVRMWSVGSKSRVPSEHRQADTLLEDCVV